LAAGGTMHGQNVLLELASGRMRQACCQRIHTQHTPLNMHTSNLKHTNVPATLTFDLECLLHQPKHNRERMSCASNCLPDDAARSRWRPCHHLLSERTHLLLYTTSLLSRSKPCPSTTCTSPSTKHAALPVSNQGQARLPSLPCSLGTLRTGASSQSFTNLK
jgi:hypothetical protein